MKCYICAEEGRDTDAVAICIVCGMGVCMEHLARKDVELWRGDYPFPARKLKKPVPRILCVICSEAYEEG